MRHGCMFATFLYLCLMKYILSFLFIIYLFDISGQTSNDIVLETAKSKLGKKVKSGVCFDLVDVSLKKVDKKWKKRNEGKYVYGKKISQSEIMPGDIVLYKGCKFKSGRTVRSHVAIIYSVLDEDRGNVEVIEQNTKGSLKKSVVVVNEKNISEKDLVRGRLEFYRPY